ncbi:hypothetical protein LBMAG53_08310 [Planctomycetota bacterium]|nr:hypothetical protein LBMAG53_08310 [Planctomycetota bacterium]
MNPQLLSLVFIAAGIVLAGEPAPAPTPPPQTSAEQTIPNRPAPEASHQRGQGFSRGGPGFNRAFLGAQVEAIDAAAGFDGKTGVKVVRVVPASTAEKIGLAVGDVITQIGASAVTSPETYREVLATFKPSEPISVAIFRDGKPKTLTGVLEAPPRPRDVFTQAEELRAEATALKDATDRAKLRTDLETYMRLLREFETGLPAAAAEFKRLYPQGTFDIQINVRITSDPTSPAQVPLAPAASPAPAAATSFAPSATSSATVPLASPVGQRP